MPKTIQKEKLLSNVIDVRMKTNYKQNETNYFEGGWKEEEGLFDSQPPPDAFSKCTNSIVAWFIF